MAEFALDHVAFGASNVEHAAAGFRRLGFTPTHIIEIDDPSWSEHLDRSALYGGILAPTGILLRGPPREEILRDPQSYEITRTVAAEPAEMKYVLQPRPTTGLPMSWIHDDSPEAMRRDAWLEHANSAVAIKAVHLRVPSAASVSPDCDLEQIGIHVCETSRDAYVRSASSLAARTEHPALLTIEVATLDLEEATRRLRANGIRVDSHMDCVSVAPDQGFGTGIRLRRATAD